MIGVKGSGTVSPGINASATIKPKVLLAGTMRDVKAPTRVDYNAAFNKPQINSVELIGDKSSEELKISSGSTAEWQLRTDYVPLAGEIIIYTDYGTDGENDIPGIKIGDGSAYAVDLPFVGEDVRDSLLSHIENNLVHITAAERAAWNAKVRCYYSNETVIFTTE